MFRPGGDEGEITRLELLPFELGLGLISRIGDQNTNARGSVYDGVWSKE